MGAEEGICEMNRSTDKKAKRKKLNLDVQAVFCRQLEYVVKSGIPLSNACEFLKADNDEYEEGAIEDVLKRLEEGANIVRAMTESGCFSEYLIAAVELGEKTGNLEQALNDLADYFERRSIIRRQIIHAFTYPLILLIMMTAIILFLIIEVLPLFASIISGAGGTMPDAAAAILGFGLWVRGCWPFILGAIALIAAFAFFAARSKRVRRKTDRLLLSLIGFGGITRKLSMSRFCSAMKMSVACGNSFLTSVEMTAGVIGNTEVKARLLKLKEDILNGAEISRALAQTGLFPKSFINLFTTAYKTGNLEQTLEKMSAYYQESYDDSVYNFTSKIEPVLVIVLSCVAGVILFSVMLPIINIMQLIS